MKKIFLFVTILLISSNIHALAVEYDGLEKLSKKNDTDRQREEWKDVTIFFPI